MQLVTIDGKLRQNDARENRVNKYAAEILIPSQFNSQIKAVRSRNEILTIAKDLGIAPGIVVGRYQILTKKWEYFHDLQRKFAWA